MKPIFITGFMGTGKTTVGKVLAEKLGCPVLDTDQMIEHAAGKQIKDIFKEDGEEVFRSLETQMIERAPSENAVITTGGGLPVRKVNREKMKESGIVIFLQTDLDVIFERVQQDENRPLASKASKEELSSLYESRIIAYEDCTIKIKTEGKTIEQLAVEIIERIKELYTRHTS